MDEATAEKIARDDGEELAGALAGALRRLVGCLQGDPDLYSSLFLLKKPIDAGRINCPLRDLALLYDARILVFDAAASTIRSNVMMHLDPHAPILPELGHLTDVLIATDWPDVPPKLGGLFDGRDSVFPLHYESFALLKQLAAAVRGEREFASVLDVFCGCGVLGIYAAKLTGGSVLFSDKYTRSLAFARLNARLNGLRRDRITRSDCFDGVPPGEQFDLVLANPPFEAVPDADRERYFRHSHGGEDGQRFMNLFLADVLRYASEGTLVVAVNFLLSNVAGRQISYHGDQILLQHSGLSQARLTLTVLDQVPLKDFWVRYDALGIDKTHELRDRVIQLGEDFLFLCTLEIDLSHAGGGVRTGVELHIEDRPPPVAWWNPLYWPLPCGISTDRETVEHWITRWLEHESEMRADQSALHAESITSGEEGSRVKYWDFHAARVRSQLPGTPAFPKPLHRALASTVLDLRYVSLATVVVPQEVSLLLLPREGSQEASYIEVTSPIMPAEAHTSRSGAADDITIQEKGLEQIYGLIAQRMRDPRCMVFLYTIMDPVDQCGTDIENVLDLPDYGQVARGCLIWRGSQFVPPLFEPSQIRYSSIIRLEKHDIQRYLLLLQLPEQGLSLLESAKALFQRGWQELVYTQCYRFMRDRMTLLAVPMILAEQARLGVLLAMAHTFRHEYNNTSGIVQYRIGQAMEAIENSLDPSARGKELLREAVEDVTGRLNFMSAGILGLDGVFDPGLREPFDKLVGEIAREANRWSDFTLEVKQPIPGCLAPRALRLVLTELIRNSYDGNPKALKDNKSCRAAISAEARGRSLVITVENPVDGSPREAAGALTSLPTYSEQPFATHLDQGIPICKYLIQRLGGQLTFSGVEETGTLKSALTIGLEDHGNG